MAAESLSSETLEILHVEDNDVDHEVLCAHLSRGGMRFAIEQVRTESEYRAALGCGRPWDIVISDYHLPGFSGLVALDYLQASGLSVPLIIVSGAIGEETAVEAMRLGASDYLLKGQFARLVMAVQSAVRAHREKLARRQSEAALSQSEAELLALSSRFYQRVEQERLTVAQEIHDDIGGTMAALLHELSHLIRVTEGETRDRLVRARETTQLAIEAAQRLMQNLRPAVLEQGLEAGMTWLCQRLEKTGGLRCRLRWSDNPPPIDAEAALVAFRFVQEALNNVVKHAQATEVKVDVSSAGGVFSVEVSDNGKGLSPQDLARPQSLGLRGLRERARTVGGWVDVSSHAHGTVLMLSIPFEGEVGATGTAEAEPQLPFY